MAIPDFEAYSRNIPVSPVQAGISGAVGGYEAAQKLVDERRAEQRRVEEMQMQRQQFASMQQLRAHQIAASRLSNVQLGRSYLAHKLADLNQTSISEQPAAYRNILTEAADLGISTKGLPTKYNNTVKNLAMRAYQSTPIALADRASALKVHIAELHNRGLLDAAAIKIHIAKLHTEGLLGAASIRARGSLGAASIRARGRGQIPSVSGQIFTPTGGAPGATAPATMAATVPAGATAPATMAATVPAGATAPATMAATAPTAVTAPGIAIRPTPALAAAYQKAAGKAFSKEQMNAAAASQAATSAIQYIDDFSRTAPKMPFGTGPAVGYLASYSGPGGEAVKAAHRLAIALLKAQHFSRPTNYELKFINKGTLSVFAKPETWKELAPQLRILNQRRQQYGDFLSTASLLGINNIGIAARIWNRYKEENPVINPNGTPNPHSLTAWRRYLTPQALKSELQLQLPDQEGERTLLGPDGKRYTISHLRAIAAGRQK